MMFTFLAAQGFPVGKSLLEADQIDTVKGYIQTAADKGVELILPVDAVMASGFAADADHVVAPADALEDTPFEFPAFSGGTRAVAQALTEVDGLSVVGGGDSAAAVRQLGFHDEQFGHISTGGGASLEFLEGKKLPGLEVLGWES